MKGFQLYVFFLCLLVFIALTALFSFMICYIGKQRGTLICNGLEDEKIKENVTKKLNTMQTKTAKVMKIVETILSIILCVFLCVLLVATGISSCRGDSKVKKIPAIKVIASTSMADRYENNKYLFENNLTNQLQMFDVVLLHELPKEEDLKLYDIVVYEHISGALLIHRIVGIEEPNEQHPEERHFLLQGDGVHYPDSYPVRYSQMRSIYHGERVPNVGSFVFFIQSPAGIICLILLVVSLILMPIADKYIVKKEYVRVLRMVKNNELDEKALELYKNLKKKFREEAEALFNENSKDENNDATTETAISDTGALNIVKRDFRTFAEKLLESPDITKERYLAIYSLIARIKGVRYIESKKQRSFKKGSMSIARLTFRGKTLCVLLGLDPSKYQDTKYVFKDVSSVKDHANYPMCVRLTSDRQTRYTLELLNELITNNNLELSAKPVRFEEIELPSKEQKPQAIRLSFGQRLRRSTKEIKNRYKVVVDALNAVAGIKVIESEHFRTFRYKNKPVAKLTMKGKTINVYLALSPSEFANTKYIFTDASAVKKYANYPMRIKLSSDRQARWTVELIKILCDKMGILKEGE